MGLVRFRHFDVTPRDRARSIRPEDITLRCDQPLEVSLAATIRHNALAVRYRGPKLMRLVTRELALAMTLFDRDRVGAPVTRNSAFAECSSHIRRFTTEVVGLGTLTAAVERIHGRAGHVAHFDALPANLQQLYAGGGRGIRPDLRFALPGMVVAGEARGRDAPAPKNTLTTAIQRRRLTELLTWSRSQRTDQVCMGWTWVQPTGTTVDFFSFPSPAPGPLSGRTLTQVKAALSAHPAGPGDAPPPPSNGDAPSNEETNPRAVLLDRVTSEIERQYLQTAPGPVPGLELPWRGEWVDIPSPYGDALTARMLFAVNGAERRTWHTLAARQRWAQTAQERALDIDADGRTLVAIDWEPRSPQLAGEEVRAALS
ncbi:hypothetical protein [Actinopolymorpha pittospori]